MMRYDPTRAALGHLQALHGPSPAERLAWLVEATDALTATLQTLSAQPTPDGAERVATQLDGMHRQAVALIPLLASHPA